MNSELTTDLRQLIERSPHNVVLIVGAGVSMSALFNTAEAKIASWAGLLRHGLARCEELGALDGSALETQLEHLASDDADRWILAAEAITAALGGPGGGEFRRWLSDTVGGFAAAARTNDVLAAIRALAARGVILATVNYDGILEEITSLPPVTWRQRAKVEAVLRGDARGILHLHGHWEEPDSVVLGGRSYDEVVEDEHARTVLEALRMTKTFVLVGHGAGLRDPNWGSFLRWTEQVFAGSSYRHYRLARDCELADVRAEHRDEQRIVALGYGADFSDLGPFLRALVPDSTRPAPVGGPEADETCVLMRINIGEKGHRFIDADEALRIVDHPDPVCLDYDFGQVFDRNTVTPRTWRAIARGLDRLVERAKQAQKGPTHFVIAARAPLPVFAYLGARMYRFKKVSIANDFDGDDWALYGPAQPVSDPGRDDFESRPPKVGEEPRGKLALVVRSSKEHAHHPESIKRIARLERQELIGCYQIFNETTTQYDVPLTNAALPLVLRRVKDALSWRREQTPSAEGLIFALACPNWLAFFITNGINPNVVGRMDFPNFVPKQQAYLPALSLLMSDAPWLLVEPRILFMSADPLDAPRTQAGQVYRAIQDEVEREYGAKGPIELRQVGATRAADLMRELDNFAPDILHLHMHGKADTVGVQDSQGDVHELPAANFVERLRAADFEPTVIVLTACHSASFAESLCGLAECVIAMVGEAKISDAIEFSQAFYGALARGKDLRRALEQGKLAASRHSIVHFLDAGVDAADVVLLPGKRRDD